MVQLLVFEVKRFELLLWIPDNYIGVKTGGYCTLVLQAIQLRWVGRSHFHEFLGSDTTRHHASREKQRYSCFQSRKPVGNAAKLAVWLVAV